MEEVKPPQHEINLSSLVRLVGSTVVLVNDALDAGRSVGGIFISKKSVDELDLGSTDPVVIRDTVSRYLPECARGKVLTWALETTPREGEVVRWTWQAHAPTTALVSVSPDYATLADRIASNYAPYRIRSLDYRLDRLGYM